MSILYSSNHGWLISHESYINSLYTNVIHEDKEQCFKLNSNLFKIINPFKRRHAKHNLKRKLSNNDEANNELQQTVAHVRSLHEVLQAEISGILSAQKLQVTTNEEAIDASKKVYEDSGTACLWNAVGENSSEAKYVSINGFGFLFPGNCKFYCKDVADIPLHLIDVKYDLIVLDPPWWNKYVRRKKAKTDHGYTMMYNDKLKEVPIEYLLDDAGLVVVWCTNSLQHIQSLRNDIFGKWNVQLVAKWYWLKITQSGDLVCPFSEPPGKQPFEHILICSRNKQLSIKPETGKLVMSVPSALHSHKPPLVELLKPYLPENPKCLEIFARYLLPNWTSWGFEALRFQHECLYVLS